MTTPHNHDADYAPRLHGPGAHEDEVAFYSHAHNVAPAHNHDIAYASATHGDGAHSDNYAVQGHNHDSAYSGSSHDHDNRYARIAGGGIIFVSNSAPSSGDGNNGDIWLEY